MKIFKLSIVSSIIFISLSNEASAVARIPSINPANVMTNTEGYIPAGSSNPSNDLNVTDELPSEHPVVKSLSEAGQFILRKVKISGARHPLPLNVKEVYEAQIGKKTGFNDIKIMAHKMENAYRADGYILVQVIVPPQEIDKNEGVITLRVLEGQIENVRLMGDDPKAAKAQLERYARAMQEEDPITYKTLDRFLTLANSLPGITVTATLMPNSTVSGAADLIIDVKQKPLSSFMNFNNRGTSYIGPGQVLAGASIYDILGADALSVAGSTSTSKAQELKYASLAYDLVVGSQATEINPSVTTTQTTPGGSLSQFDLYGVSTRYNLSVNQPLYVSSFQNVTLQTALYHLDAFNSAFQSFHLYDDEITGLSIGADYKGILWKAYNDVNFSSTAGLPVFGAPSTLSNPSVANGKTEFIKFNLATSSVRYLSERVSINLKTEFQLTPDTMLSSEQIGYGGQYFGQAFIPYIISGDNGAMGSLALAYDLPVFSPFKLIQPQVFYDAGVVGLNAPSAGNPNQASGQSAGMALNLQVTNHWSCLLTLAKPVRITQVNSMGMGWNAFANLTGIF